jgi:hypothetical protein
VPLSWLLALLGLQTHCSPLPPSHVLCGSMVASWRSAGFGFRNQENQMISHQDPGPDASAQNIYLSKAMF